MRLLTLEVRLMSLEMVLMSLGVSLGQELELEFGVTMMSLIVSVVCLLHLEMRLMSLEMVLMSLGVGLEQELGDEFGDDVDEFGDLGCVFPVC